MVGTWTVTSGTNSWSTGTNWYNGIVPGSTVGDVGNLTASVTANSFVYLTGGETLGTLNIGTLNTGGVFTYTLSGASTLTLDNGGPSATAYLTEMGTAAGDTINTPLSLNSNLLLSNLANGGNATMRTLTIGGAINATATAAGASIAINPVGSVTFNGAIGSNIGNISIGSGINANSPSNDTVTFAVANSFTGAMTIATGIEVTLSGSNAMSSVTVNSGYLNLNVANANVLGTGSLTINGGELNAGVAGIPALNIASQTWNQSFTAYCANPLNMGTGPVTLGGNIAIGTGNSGGNNPLTIGGAIGDGGHGYGLTLVSAYNTNSGFILNGNNTYTGPTTLIGVFQGVGGVGGFTLQGSNSTSGITLEDAILFLGSSGTVANSAVLGNGTLTVKQGSVINNPYSGLLTLSTTNNQTWAGDFTFKMSGNASSSVNFGSGTVTLTGNRTIYSNSNGGAVIIGGITDNGNGYSLTNNGNTNLHSPAPPPTAAAQC